MKPELTDKQNKINDELLLFIKECSSHSGSSSNYTEFKRINECLSDITGNSDISILDYENPVEFEDVVNKLKQNQKYIDYNKKGNNQYSSTIKNYQQFLYARKFKHLSSSNSEAVAEKGTEYNSIKFSTQFILSAIKSTHLIYESTLIKRLVFSLLTKPFVILSGLAGSGKTQLALALAKSLVANEDEQLCVVPVGADWNNREPLLGYPNALNKDEYVKPENGVLDLMISANNNPEKPYFLILDEMNLSYVERYFADFLSAMESKKAIPLWNGAEGCDVPASIALPKNLFIIGTINVDETTYMFSPKVLDRANVIEFKVSIDDMKNFFTTKPNADVELCNGKAANMAEDFVAKAKAAGLSDINENASKTLQEFFAELKKVNAEFGYRTATEIAKFITLATESNDGLNETDAVDAAIVQKLLPKLHGSRKKIDPVLEALWHLCLKTKTNANPVGDAEEDEILYKLAADKIVRMYNTAIANGFTSFAEA